MGSEKKWMKKRKKRTNEHLNNGQWRKEKEVFFPYDFVV